ncbi:unnamed protein product [Bemisia tabaci]|uniref:protein-serine/threonine phosphatase n=1 Tax=Bemisia tabaci TaxID=7038 RepID=A0A9P0AM07_BEMTA|nr:unnamed protein product [Bemisia tabaci]
MIVPEMKLDRRQCLSGTRCEAHEVNFIAIFTSLLVALSVSHAFSVERLNVEGTLDRISNSDLRSHREFETNYTGPVLENEKVTLKFMTDLLKFYNDCLIITSIEKPYSILPEKDVFTILKQARDYFKKQPSLVDIKLPKNENITVCGGIHGKLLNLVHIFSLNGLPSPKNRYLFNGDITGRRFKSIECLLLYFGFKLLYPDAVFINRGHKEDQGQNYGLDDLVEECRTKYPRNAKLLHGFWEVFQWMPLAHIISTDIAEKKNAGAEVLINDMLWSDWNIPEACRNVTQVEKNQPNITSQIGPDESKSFCEANKIDYIIRNFAPLDEGYCVEHNGRIVSLISTDEFTDTAKGLNKGALIVLESPGLIPKFTKFRFTFVILKQTCDHFKTQPSLQEVELKPAEKIITVCGNIHGKLEDLLHIFDINGFPSPSNRYLFNGGFINRRPESIECALILFGFALLYPDSFFINRGSHEDFHQSQGKGSLTEESERKYPGNSEVLHGFWEVFRWLPLALIIRGNVPKKVDSFWSATNLIRPITWGRKMYHRFTGQRKIRIGAYTPSHGRILVVHAGLFSKPGVTLDDIQRIERGCDPEESALMFDMLWSNPGEKDGRHQNIPGFGSIQFGPDISESFCTRNKIDYIIRSHAPVPMGYHVEHHGRVVTIFSTTDCHRDNRGAIAVVKAPELKPVFTVFAFKYDYKEARCLWLGEKNIAVEKYNTIGVEQTEGSPLG